MCAITLLAILATPQAPKQWTSYIQSHVTGHTIGRVEGQYYNDEDKQAFRTDKAGYDVDDVADGAAGGLPVA